MNAGMTAPGYGLRRRFIVDRHLEEPGSCMGRRRRRAKNQEARSKPGDQETSVAKGLGYIGIREAGGSDPVQCVGWRVEGRE